MYTNEQILSTFKDAIKDTSIFISKLSDYKNLFAYISNQTMDNADPELAAGECLEKLETLLAILNIYYDEYSEDPIDEKTGKHRPINLIDSCKK
jgi:hypothetical protein